MEEQTQTPLQESQSGQEGLKDRKIMQLDSEDGAAPVQLSGPPDNLLQRINYLDSILTGMEAPTEPNSSPPTSPRPMSCRHSSAPTTPLGLERRRKPTGSVLEEVYEKGTLVERVSDLEKRVMKLQRMLSSKSHENVAAHRRSKSHQEVYNQLSLQEPIDVEKHEVPLSYSDPPVHKDHIGPFTDTSGHEDTHSSTSESPHERASSGKLGANAAEQSPSASPGQRSKKKMLGIKKWLSKRLHMRLPGTSSQGKHNSLSIGHCLGPKIHPKNCCNASRKRGMNTNSYRHCHPMSIDDD